MKTKSVVLIFILVAIFLTGAFFFSEKILSKDENSVTRAKVITPKASEVAEQESEYVSAVGETEKYETFVPLAAGETLISTLTVDINNDGYDDEVVIVRKNTSPYLLIVPGLYIIESGEYLRLAEIETVFTKTRNFSYSAMDMIGNHKNSIVFQGIDDAGNSVMQIYLCTEDKKLEVEHLELIGDFSSDGTVFIQQTERSENYELGISKGEPYSVWVYKTEQLTDEEKEAAAKNKNYAPNQIQQEYKWNAAKQEYELDREIKVTASRLMAKELSKIQDGTVESFAGFLDGLWYKTSNKDGGIRYLYFNFDKKEIIHLFEDSQEVYQWDGSKVRHNGIYLTTVNADIMTLHRRFDISLVNTDEIKVTIRDDINLVIKESTMWDGQYKKLSLQNSFEDKTKESDLTIAQRELQKGLEWNSADGETKLKFDEFKYTLKYGSLVETGIYSASKFGSNIVLQFRSDSDSSMLSDAYSIEFGTKTVTETIKKKTVETVVTDYDFITFVPVKITPLDCFTTEGRSYNFTR